MNSKMLSNAKLMNLRWQILENPDAQIECTTTRGTVGPSHNPQAVGSYINDQDSRAEGDGKG